MKNILLLIYFILVFAFQILAQTDQGLQTDSVIFNQPKIILEAVAGDGPGQFGIMFQQEGLPVLPNDFVIDSKGALWIMDVLNRRVQKFDEKGNFILQFPDESNKSPIEVDCDYVKCDLEGNIVLGPTIKSGNFIILDNNGKFLRNFQIPGVMKFTIFNFAINSSNEILYPAGRGRDRDLVAIDITGKILYAIKGGQFLSGENVTPYSKYMIKNIYFPVQKSNIYYGDIKGQPKSIINIDSEFSSQGPKGTSKSKLKINKYVFLADSEGNLFVKTLVSVSPSKFAYSYHAPDGRYIQTLQNPPELNEKVIQYRNTIDKEGNLYLMRIYEPQGIEIIYNEPIKGGTPCLRIWKWERIK
jgi:hypothetical protein